MSGSAHVTLETVGSWKQFTKDAVKFLHSHRHLLDAYVLDFFTQDLWSDLNPKWTSVLEKLTPSNLADFISRDAQPSFKTVWPLSLLALRATSFTYTLPRQSVSSLDRLLDYLDSYVPVETESSVASHHTSNPQVNNHEDIHKHKYAGCQQTSCGTSNQLCEAHIKRREPTNVDSVSISISQNISDHRTISPSHNSNVYDNLADKMQESSVNEKVDTLKNQMKSLSVNDMKHECLEPDGRIVSSVSPIHQVEINWGDTASELSAAAGQHKLLQHVFRRHLKPKKQHEVARLALVAGCVCGQTGATVAVDVGAGQGHLSRLLAYGHCLRVVSIEAQDEFIAGARKFDQQLEAAVEKMKRCRSDLPPLPPSPRHSVCHLDPDTTPEDFTQVVYRTWSSDTGECGGDDKRCGLVGLHTCGDLGPTLLRLFINTPVCRALVSVGCCYMKLTEAQSDGSLMCGYPLSECVQQLPGHKLSYTAREVACHAIEMYAHRLQGGADNLKIHCYRACLESILIRYWPHHRHAGLRSVNKAHLMDFPTYAAAAVSKLQDVRLAENDLTCDHTLHSLSRWMQVVVYYSLRLLLAPVVETVILLDRLFFLYENGVDGLLFPAFDPQLSPRNHVLVAVKMKKKE